MKVISFADAKRTILTFEAEHAEFAQDGDAFIITANGEITFQDMGAWEDLHHNGHSCLLSVKEGETTLLHSRYYATFMALEPELMVVRIRVGE